MSPESQAETQPGTPEKSGLGVESETKDAATVDNNAKEEANEAKGDTAATRRCFGNGERF